MTLSAHYSIQIYMTIVVSHTHTHSNNNRSFTHVTLISEVLLTNNNCSFTDKDLTEMLLTTVAAPLYRQTSQSCTELTMIEMFTQGSYRYTV